MHALIYTNPEACSTEPSPIRRRFRTVAWLAQSLHVRDLFQERLAVAQDEAVEPLPHDAAHAQVVRARHGVPHPLAVAWWP